MATQLFNNNSVVNAPVSHTAVASRTSGSRFVYSNMYEAVQRLLAAVGNDRYDDFKEIIADINAAITADSL